MPIAVDDILDILREYGIDLEDLFADIDLPGIGELEEGETIYSTSIEEVFAEETGRILPDIEDERLSKWRYELERIAASDDGPEWRQFGERRGISDPPEPYCAWYCPLHFFWPFMGYLHPRELHSVARNRNSPICQLARVTKANSNRHTNPTSAERILLPVFTRTISPQSRKPRFPPPYYYRVGSLPAVQAQCLSAALPYP